MRSDGTPRSYSTNFTHEMFLTEQGKLQECSVRNPALCGMGRLF